MFSDNSLLKLIFWPFNVNKKCKHSTGSGFLYVALHWPDFLNIKCYRLSLIRQFNATDAKLHTWLTSTWTFFSVCPCVFSCKLVEWDDECQMSGRKIASKMTGKVLTGWQTRISVVLSTLSVSVLVLLHACPGLPALATSGIIGAAVGNVVKRYFWARNADEDLATWDYVARHPEDFPELRRKIALSTISVAVFLLILLITFLNHEILWLI